MLREAYERLLAHLKKSKTSVSSGIMPTNMLCISTPESYLNSDVKVMVFGQETNDWEGDFDHPGGIDHLLKTYDDFFSSGYCFRYGGQFWNGISKLNDRIKQEFSKENKSVGLIWNNIVKIGRSGEKGLPSPNLVKWQRPAFEIIKEEVKYYQPDIVFFFTGPNYDRFIVQAFNDASFERVEGRTSRQLAKVKSRYLPMKSIRTYHPNYLWRIGFYEYLDEIIKEIYS